jgi:hypothetical protein
MPCEEMMPSTRRDVLLASREAVRRHRQCWKWSTHAVCFPECARQRRQSDRQQRLTPATCPDGGARRHSSTTDTHGIIGCAALEPPRGTYHVVHCEAILNPSRALYEPRLPQERRAKQTLSGMRTGKGDSCMAIVVGSSCFEDSLVRPCLTHVTVARERHGKGVASLLRRDAASIGFYSTACSSSSQPGSRADLVYVTRAVKHLAHAHWSLERALIEFDVAFNGFAA